MGWRFPLRFGARDKTRDIEHQALLDALKPAFDVGEETEIWAETRVDALAVEMIWRINRRVGNQNFPRRMLENLPPWEQSCGLRPSVDDGDGSRRDRLAAKLRGLRGNSREDLRAAAIEALGVHYGSLWEVDPDDEITYWPNLNPGPPGYEWSSNRATVVFRMTKQQLSDGEFRLKRNWLIEIISQMCPAWETFVVTTSEQFFFSVGIVGQSVIA